MGKGDHSTKVEFALLIQLPRVQILAQYKIFSSQGGRMAQR